MYENVKGHKSSCFRPLDLIKTVSYILKNNLCPCYNKCCRDI